MDVISFVHCHSRRMNGRIFSSRNPYISRWERRFCQWTCVAWEHLCSTNSVGIRVISHVHMSVSFWSTENKIISRWMKIHEREKSLSLCCHVCSSRSIGKFRCVSSYRVMSFECESRSRSSVYDTRSKIINISKSTNAIRDSPRLITANVASKITAKLTGWRFLNFSLDFILFTTLPFIRAALLWKI